jgi:methylglutaconyl-CoA hydratase
MTTSLRLSLSGDVATVTLTRPEVHNALDETLIGNLAQAFQKLSVTDAVRVVVLAAEGQSFCAGGDVAWLQRAAALPPEENRRDAMELAIMLDAIERCTKPVVAVVQGAALGGGLGLTAVADIVIASEQASFGMSEIRLGLSSSVTAPYVTAAIGARAYRRYALTGERFDAREAWRLGLVHTVVAAERLDEVRDRIIDALRKGGPKAQADNKELLRVLAQSEPGPDLMRWTAARLAEARVGDETREGLAAFVAKRSPEWAV